MGDKYDLIHFFKKNRILDAVSRGNECGKVVRTPWPTRKEIVVC